MSLPEFGSALAPEHRVFLLRLAERSIRYGLVHGRPMSLLPHELPEQLTSRRATFVTLEMGGNLRGCIGTLEAVVSVAEGIARNAFAAAFTDPRFPPVTAAEVDALDIHLSILSPAEEIAFTSEDELLANLRPFVDGVILQEGRRRGTFLPSVWEALPEPRVFLQHLKRKAGMPKDHWSDTLKVYRYRAEIIR